MTKAFRITGWLEGASFLILLFIAMPLKYHWHMPMAVRIVGMAHGLLFMGYLYYATDAASRLNWSHRKQGFAYLAAFLPFGTFVFNAKYLNRD